MERTSFKRDANKKIPKKKCFESFEFDRNKFKHNPSSPHPLTNPIHCLTNSLRPFSSFLLFLFSLSFSLSLSSFNNTNVSRANYDKRYIFRPVALINSFCCVHMHRGAKQESLKKKQNAREQQTGSRSHHQQANSGQNKSSIKPKLTHRGLVSLVRK